MKYLINPLSLLIMMLGTLLVSCNPSFHHPLFEQPQGHTETNAVYYWKTKFELDSADYAFIREHQIGRLYVRMFDVCCDEHTGPGDDGIYPNASLTISRMQYDKLRIELEGIEFVPVVYITLEALKAANDRMGELSGNIISRVRNMCEYNAFNNVSELQLDCDWTRSTEESFFELCDSVRGAIRKEMLPWQLSSTIRLHQLSHKTPPVDRGVLMVYNTGDFASPSTANSIISLEDVEPYLRYLPSYPLHLDIAYPTYSWQLLFDDYSFGGLLRGVNVGDSTSFVKRQGYYVATKDIPFNTRIIHAGDRIRCEDSEFGDVMAVKSRIEQCLSRRAHSNILYHFDKNNFSKYSSDELDKLLMPGF